MHTPLGWSLFRLSDWVTCVEWWNGREEWRSGLVSKIKLNVTMHLDGSRFSFSFKLHILHAFWIHFWVYDVFFWGFKMSTFVFFLLCVTQRRKWQQVGACVTAKGSPIITIFSLKFHQYLAHHTNCISISTKRSNKKRIIKTRKDHGANFVLKQTSIERSISAGNSGWLFEFEIPRISSDIGFLIDSHSFYHFNKLFRIILLFHPPTTPPPWNEKLHNIFSSSFFISFYGLLNVIFLVWCLIFIFFILLYLQPILCDFLLFTSERLLTYFLQFW